MQPALFVLYMALLRVAVERVRTLIPDRIMNILDPNFDIHDDDVHRLVFLDYIIKESDKFPVILLLDPDRVVDMQSIENRINNYSDLGLAMSCDMSQCQTSNYVPFVNQLARPFAQGAIDYLLLDKIDEIPDSELRNDFEQLLKYMAKKEDYDPFQNIHDVETDIKRETEDFSNAGHLIMRCSETPSFLQSDTFVLIACKDFVRLTAEFVTKDK